MSLNKNMNNFTNRFFEDDANDKETNVEPKVNNDDITKKKIDFTKEKTETRSKQVHCFMKPSLYKKIKALAKENGISCNEVINRILESTIK